MSLKKVCVLVSYQSLPDPLTTPRLRLGLTAGGSLATTSITHPNLKVLLGGLLVYGSSFKLSDCVRGKNAVSLVSYIIHLLCRLFVIGLQDRASQETS